MSTVATATEKKAHMGTDEKPERKLQRARADDKFKIFCGTANEALADEVCAFLGLTRGKAHITRFSDGEAYVQIGERARRRRVRDAAHVPSGGRAFDGTAADDGCAEARVGTANHAVIPYYGYARQDRKDKPRVPVSSKLVADLLTTAGADRALVVDLHAPQIQGFFNIPVDHLFAFAGAGGPFPGD